MDEKKKRNIMKSLNIILVQTRYAKAHLRGDKYLRKIFRIKRQNKKERAALPWENTTIGENLATIEAYTEHLTEDLRIEWKYNNGEDEDSELEKEV